MNNENCYYVYLHRRATDNKVFYVGKGKGRRAWNFNNRNQHWTNVKNKHGVIVDIVFDELTEEQSLQIEKDTILEFTYFGYPLTNKSSGGESPVFSEESREKMRNRPKRIKTQDEIDRIANFHKGRKRSEETCERISKSLKGKNSHQKQLKSQESIVQGLRLKMQTKQGITLYTKTGIVSLVLEWNFVKSTF